MTEAFTGNLDLASLTLWLFWIFFALLIFYIQRENMREGFPLVDDDGEEAPSACPACAHPQAHFEVLAENW